MSVFKLEAELTLKSKEYEAQLKAAANETENTAKALDARTIAIGNVIANLATKAGQYFVKGAQVGLEYNKQIQKYAVALKTALGSEAAAANALEQIKRDAARTPYDVSGLTAANMYLISAGESAESARATIMALGDAVAATGGGNAELQRMAQNLQQIRNVGKATSMDIRQFAMAGIDIYGLLADYTGKSTAEVQNLTITYDMLSAALQNAAEEGGKYFNAMSDMSRTLGGQWDTLRDNVKSKLGEAFESLAGTLTDSVLPAANRVVEGLDMTNTLSTVAKASAVILSFVTAMKAAEVATKAAATAQKVWNAAVESGKLAAGGWVAAVIALVIGINDSQKAYDEMMRSQAEGLTTLEESANRVEELRNEIDALATSKGNVNELNNAEYAQLAKLKEELKYAEERYNELKAAEDAVADATGNVADGFDEMVNSTDEAANSLVEIITNYDKLHEDIAKKVDGWFGLFDAAGTKVKTSVDQMKKNMQSQIDFNTKYSSNLKYLADNGLAELGTAFQSMGADGAAYADALVQAIEKAGGASSEGGQQVIADFTALAQGVDASKADLTQSLTDMTGTLEAQLAEWGGSAEAAAQALDVSPTASKAAQATVNAYIAGISGGAGGAKAAATKVAAAAAAGFNAFSGKVGGGVVPQLAVGSDYIPYDNYPALLHKGEMVVPAKISEDLRDFVGAGGRPAQGAAIQSGNSTDGEVVILLRELIAATKRPVVLDSGQLVGGIGTKMDGQLGELDGYGRRGLSLA